jgi:AraC family transcriptional regulator, regulatory protein of adaptative response / methylated-DNA-[protein]-cysteine methyltransferase
MATEMALTSDRLAAIPPRSLEAADAYWTAVSERDKSFDGVIYYAVRSTGIYCQPSCPSRRPRRENIEFFTHPEHAERAGFRACRRCRPNQVRTTSAHVEIVRIACRYVEQNLESSLTLEEIAQSLGVSGGFLHRTFKALTGITPRQYVEARRLNAFKLELRLNQRSVTDAIYEAGYGSSSRLYERASEFIGMSPRQYRTGAPETQIRYATAECSLGWVLIAATDVGICAVKVGDSDDRLERELFSEYRKAEIMRDQTGLGPWLREVIDTTERADARPVLPLDIQATAFQRRVYEVLCRIPRGEVRSYAQVADAIGDPKATRAVAQACAHNPVALLVPCHRVVRSDGASGGYRWGERRKKKLLRLEAQATREGQRAAAAK